MQKILESAIENIYSHNLPMPVVSVSEIRIQLEKFSTYIGVLELMNTGEGTLMGFIDTKKNLISIKDPIINTNRRIIEYSVDTKNLNIGTINEDKLIITYNGGELFIPIYIQVQAPVQVAPRTILRAKKNKKLVELSTNKRSYQIDEPGLLTIRNYHHRSVTVRLMSEEPYILFKTKELDVTDIEVVEFSFKISKLDKMLGKIPLKTNPKIEMKIDVEVVVGSETTIFSKVIYLTDLLEVPSEDRINTESAYRKQSMQAIRKLQHLIFQENETNFISLQRDIESLLSFDQTNIELRLMHLFIQVRWGRKKACIEEINGIEHFMLHYDLLNSDVTDLLTLFLEMLKKEHVEDLVSGWKPKTKENWLKILIKNRVLENSTDCYADYRSLYQLGARNTLLYIEAANCLNHSPILPDSDDEFYWMVLRWSIRHNLLGSKWLKKIETGNLSIRRDAPIKVDLAEKLYQMNPSKNLRILLCNGYIRNNSMDAAALMTYEDAIIERYHVSQVESYYIMASYCNRRIMKADCMKLIYHMPKLEEPYRSFYLLHVLFYRGILRTQFHLFEKDIMFLRGVNLSEELVIEGEIKESYIHYLLDTKQYEHLMVLIQRGFLQGVHHLTLLDVIMHMSETFHEEMIQLALNLFYQTGLYNDQLLQLIASHFKGDLAELLGFYKLINENGIVSNQLEEDILFKGIVTRKYPDEIIGIFIRYCRELNHGLNQKWLVQYLNSIILLEDFQPTREMLKVLEMDLQRERKTLTGLSYLKGSIGQKEPNEELISELISEFLGNDILLPWFTRLLPMEALGEKWYFMECFEYYSHPDVKVYLYYRLEDENNYHCVEMKTIGLGIYMTHVILFYQERIQYYIKEISKESSDVRLCDIFTKESSEELRTVETLYDRINTIEMCKLLDDDQSVAGTISDYFRACKHDLEEIIIL